MSFSAMVPKTPLPRSVFHAIFMRRSGLACRRRKIDDATVRAPFRSSSRGIPARAGQEIARAIPKAAAAARPPTSAVCKALRMGLAPVK
jgi:hypothetical protein